MKRMQCGWCEDRGWLWWSTLAHDYVIPDVCEKGVYDPKQRRYVLDQIVAGKSSRQGLKVLVHGPAGAGKTTLASTFPSPVFLDLEGSTERFEVNRIDLRDKPFDGENSVMQFLRVLGREEHDFQTVVIDTLDWLEPKVWASTCKRLEISSIEQAGYGKGYIEALQDWDLFFRALTYLRDKKGMHIVLNCHTSLVKISDPILTEYDRWDLKLHKRAAAKFVEWSEIVGFLTIETMIRRMGGKDRLSTEGERVLLINEAAHYVSKNRFAYAGDGIKPATFETLKQGLGL